MITNVAAYGLSLSHVFFRSIQEIQYEWDKSIFGERGLGNWPQEINTTKNFPRISENVVKVYASKCFGYVAVIHIK
jgi:hypothetical protein